MRIEYYRKNVYGRENTYIANPLIAKQVSCLTHKKTIDIYDLVALDNLGFELVEIIAPKL